MHQNLSITDGVYGILSESDIERQIRSLSEGKTIPNSRDRDLEGQVQIIMEVLNRLGVRKDGQT